MGTDKLRPSLSLMSMVVSDTVTCVAAGPTNSFAEMLIPCFYKSFQLCLNNTLNPPDFDRPEAGAVLITDGVQPELRHCLIPLHMDMQRFTSIAGVKIEPVWAIEEYCRHDAMLSGTWQCEPCGDFSLRTSTSIALNLA